MSFLPAFLRVPKPPPPDVKSKKRPSTVLYNAERAQPSFADQEEEKKKKQSRPKVAYHRRKDDSKSASGDTKSLPFALGRPYSSFISDHSLSATGVMVPNLAKANAQLKMHYGFDDTVMPVVEIFRNADEDFRERRRYEGLVLSPANVASMRKAAPKIRTFFFAYYVVNEQKAYGIGYRRADAFLQTARHGAFLDMDQSLEEHRKVEEICNSQTPLDQQVAKLEAIESNSFAAPGLVVDYACCYPTPLCEGDRITAKAASHKD
jgi:hypothetical protein